MSLCGLLLKGFGPSGTSPPAAPALTVVDGENGSSAVATITGGDPGATNAVSVQGVSTVGGTWTAAGSRSGNGVVTLTLDRGYYWARCLSSKGGVSSLSNLVYFAVTEGTDAHAMKIMDALEAIIQGLLLPGVDGTNVQKAKLPWERLLKGHMPGVLVAPQPENINAAAGTNVRDDIDYRFSITFARASNQDLTSNLNWMFLVRQRVRKAIHNLPLTVTGTVPWRCVIEPGAIYVPPAFAQSNIDTGYLIARVTNREFRT